MEIARDNSLDMAKGLGIILVILGHLLTYGNYPFQVIFSFHMPLFFFLSGYVFSLRSYPNKYRLAGKILRTMVTAYLFFILFGALFYAVTGRLEVNRELFYSIFYKGQPAVCGSLWFIACLSLVYVAAWGILRRLGTLSWKFLLGISALCLLLGYLFAEPLHEVVPYLPFKLASVPAALMYFLVGYFVRQQGWTKFNGWWGIPAFLLVAFLADFNATPNLCLPAFGNLLYFLPASFLGIYAIRALSDHFTNRFICFLGRNSLIIFLMDEFVRYIYIGILNQLTGMQYEAMANIPRVYCYLGTVIVVGGCALSVYALLPLYYWFSGKMAGFMRLEQWAR